MSLMSTRTAHGKAGEQSKKKKTARHDKYLYTLYYYYCVLVKKKKTYSDVDICNFYARHTCVCLCAARK